MIVTGCIKLVHRSCEANVVGLVGRAEQILRLLIKYARVGGRWSSELVTIAYF